MKNILSIALASLFFIQVQAQNFEPAQIDTINFEKVSPFLHANFALQFQGLNQSADSVPLIPLGKGFNLPTANFTVGAHLAQGVQVVLESYLSSKHHNETWVKGGYLLIDQLPFIPFEKVEDVMNYLTIKAGVMELNYGDAHFRRSDNGNVINNPFVGNYIMNAFTTAPAAEVYFRNNGIIVVGGVSQVSVNQQIVEYDKNDKEFKTYDTKDELSFYGKLGYDAEIDEDIRVRATASVFTGKNHGLSLYSGDRAGSRYYLVMKQQKDSLSNATNITTGHLLGDYYPDQFGTVTQDNSVMLNLYTEFKGFHLFGTYELAKGSNRNWNAAKNKYDFTDFTFNQFAIEGLYYFGKEKQFYLGTRYNIVQDHLSQSVQRINGVGGWNMTKNILTKLEYVHQTYNNFAAYKNAAAGFNGLMLEAAISF